MGYDRMHILLTWGGDLPGGEKWTCGIRLAGQWGESLPLPWVISDEFLGTMADHYQTQVTAYHTNPDTGIDPRAKLTFVKAAGIGKDGKYLPGQVSRAERAITPVGGGAAGLSAYPNQTTMVVTLHTAFARGKAHAGRFFLPLPAWPVTSDGTISVANATKTAGTSKTFLEAISDVPGIDIPTSPGAAVMSKIGTGVTHQVTGVSVGRVLDTHRSRRRSLKEDRQFAVVDQGAF